MEDLEAKYMKMKARLTQVYKEAKHYKKQLMLDEKMFESIQLECERKVESIRSFWQDKIYEEHTRSGKILKRAMQKQLIN